MLFLTGLQAMFMETANLIATGMDPMDAYNVTVFNGSDWAKAGAQNLQAAASKCDSNKEAGDKNRAFNEGVIRKQYASVTDHQTLADKIHLQMESIYPWSVWGVAVATQGSGDTAKCHVW